MKCCKPLSTNFKCLKGGKWKKTLNLVCFVFNGSLHSPKGDVICLRVVIVTISSAPILLSRFWRLDKTNMRRSLLHITVCKSHVSVDMNGKRLSHYIGRQWRLTGAVLRRGWDPQESPFAPEHEQNEINRRRKADRQSASRGWKGKKQLW